MKTGRNAPCTCGSGKKYKFCCLGKSNQQKYFEAVASASSNLKNEARIKVCLHPDNQHCNDKIIKAHAIQNNRILKKLCVDGELITTDGQSHLFFQDTQKKGRKIATTFTGFCGYHDKTTFQEIEDKEFEGTIKQIFLFTYRTMAWHYQKKMEQFNAHCIVGNKLSNLGYVFDENSTSEEFGNMLEDGLKDNNLEIEEFNNALAKEDYNQINSIVWEIPYEIDFAISMMHELEYDINGNLINDLELPQRPKKIYLNIFPGNKKSYCIWSWLKIWDYIYIPFSKQFLSLSDDVKANYFNNNLPVWSDSLVLSPRIWDDWGKEIQQAFISHANMGFLYRMFEKEQDNNSFEFMDTPWDLFCQFRDVEIK